jgi:hypothetical protein
MCVRTCLDWPLPASIVSPCALIHEHETLLPAPSPLSRQAAADLEAMASRAATLMQRKQQLTSRVTQLERDVRSRWAAAGHASMHPSIHLSIHVDKCCLCYHALPILPPGHVLTSLPCILGTGASCLSLRTVHKRVGGVPAELPVLAPAASTQQFRSGRSLCHPTCTLCPVAATSG